MPSRFNMSQLKSQMRQAQRKAERQMQSEINRATRKYENEMNRERQKYNAAVRHNQQLINCEIDKLKSHTTAQSDYLASIYAMYRLYTIVRNFYTDNNITSEQDYIINLVEQEQVNGLITANVVEYRDFPTESIKDEEIGDELLLVSKDLYNRWQGAIYALNPLNPDAARHFCTSVRQIFTDFIESKAPDAEVFAYKPDAERTKQGNATRKEKIRYMMRDLEMEDCVVDFADADIQNILELFFIFNGATHGEAGKYEFAALLQVKKRVEQGIHFLCGISAGKEIKR